MIRKTRYWLCFNTRPQKLNLIRLSPEIDALDSTTGGEIYFVLTEKPVNGRRRLTTFNCKGDYSQRLETGGSYINGLRAAVMIY